MSDNNNSSPFRTGIIVITVLAIFTVAEFLISQATNGSLVPLAIIAVIKAVLIVQYFMHVSRTLNPDEEGGGH